MTETITEAMQRICKAAPKEVKQYAEKLDVYLRDKLIEAGFPKDDVLYELWDSNFWQAIVDTSYQMDGESLKCQFEMLPSLRDYIRKLIDECPRKGPSHEVNFAAYAVLCLLGSLAQNLDPKEIEERSRLVVPAAEAIKAVMAAEIREKGRDN
jgi:hypothetical protein